MAEQPQGFYPRLNAQMLHSDPQFDGMIVSLLGRVQSKNLADGTAEFQCSDGGIVSMDISQAELPENTDDCVFEAIGQLGGGSFSVSVAE